MDDDVIGLSLQVREIGRKSFTLDHTFEGRRPAAVHWGFSGTGRCLSRANTP
jgi:hypothetical protein